MKFRLMAAILGLTIAIPGAVSAQNPDDQAPDQAPKPSPNIQAPLQSPNDQGSMDQNSMNQGSMEQGSNDQGLRNQGSSTPASAETNASVARISLIHGQVSTQRGDTGDWAAAALNAPMVAGDKISTGDQSRVEVQLDYANILRLSGHSQATIATLAQKQIQIQLGQGLSTYTVFKDGEADVELDTPNASVHPGARDGSYRILVVSDTETDVVVRRGEAEIATPQGKTHVRSGQSIVISGTGDDTTTKISDATPRDDWDRWNSDRDNLIQNAQGRRHTNRYYVGSEDLDAHGSWKTVPDYGQVWAPDVGADWAPYQDGQWDWEPYWGWTWVSYEPWGWAPYHYGRWFMYDNAWMWWPGPVYGYPFYRPLWAPAYVSFFGFGGGFGFGFGWGWGSIGWLPIGPCDGFYPWWGRYRSRFNVVNVTNIRNVRNFRGVGMPPLHRGTQFSNLRMATTNDRMRRAISTVNAKDFGHGRVTPQPVSREAFRSGGMVTGNLPVAPTRASLNASGRPAAASTLPARGSQPQHFFGRTPASTNRQSFDKEAAQVQSAIRQNGRFTSANENRLGQTSQAQPRSQGTGTTNNSSGANWRRSGQGPQVSSGAQTHAGPSNAGSLSSRGSESWRNIPRPGSTNQPASPNSGTNPASRGSGMNTQGERQTGNHNSSSDWRRFTPNNRPSSAEPANRGQGGGSSGNGNWRQASPRAESPASRPPLEMRHPIVTPRYSGPRYSGPGYSAPRSSGPGYSAPRSSAPSGRGGSSGGGRSSGGGSHSGGGGHHR